MSRKPTVAMMRIYIGSFAEHSSVFRPARSYATIRHATLEARPTGVITARAGFWMGSRRLGPRTQLWTFVAKHGTCSARAISLGYGLSVVSFTSFFAIREGIHGTGFHHRQRPP